MPWYIVSRTVPNPDWTRRRGDSRAPRGGSVRQTDGMTIDGTDTLISTYEGNDA